MKWVSSRTFVPLGGVLSRLHGRKRDRSPALALDRDARGARGRGVRLDTPEVNPDFASGVAVSEASTSVTKALSEAFPGVTWEVASAHGFETADESILILAEMPDGERCRWVPRAGVASSSPGYIDSVLKEVRVNVVEFWIG